MIMVELRLSSVVALRLASCIIALQNADTVHGFAPPPGTNSISNTKPHHTQITSLSFQRNADIIPSSSGRSSTRITSTSLRETKDGSASSSASDGKKKRVSSKLLEESVAPFRGLRLFLYGSFASGAAVGGFITATGIAAALSGARPDLDLNAEYINLAIDFGAVAVFGILAKIDLDNGAKLSNAVEERVEKSKQMKKVTSAMREREAQLKELNINVRVTEDGQTKVASVGVMQEKARQDMILVAGPGRAIRDALRGAQLGKMNFAMTNVLVVPYETGMDAADRASKPDGSGFGDARPTYETQAYVAEPVGDGWEEFIDAEMTAAAEQAGEKVRDEGIALVVSNDGKVLRRGVGKVPWRQMVDELEEAVTGEKKESGLPSLLGLLEE